MNVYTKKGDTGVTSLFGGTTVAKDDVRVWAYGTVDEANSVLGVIYASLAFADLKDVVRDIQRKLFIVGAGLASDDAGRQKLDGRVTEDDVVALERVIDGYTDDFGKVTGFSIPGETAVSALFHVARTVVRRAERHVVTLAGSADVDPIYQKYLNRLSDALFILAKKEVYATFVAKVAEKIGGGDGSGGGSVSGTVMLGDPLFTRLARAAAEESATVGIAVSLAVVDSAGVLAYFCRDPKAIQVSVGVAQNKAYTAAVMKAESGGLADVAQPGGALYGLTTADPRLVVFGGGFPLFAGGELVGAIGVSGGSAAQDEQVGRRVVAEFSDFVQEGDRYGRREH
jgi:ATP:cob(I)alamin adenosyltransferase